MKQQTRFLSVASLLALGFFSASPVLAHHPSIAASAVCTDGSLVINYTASANAAYTHPSIQILLNSSVVHTGAFAAPDYAFSGSLPAPSGTSAIVGLLAVGLWSDGAEGGQSSQVTVTYPADPCAVPTFGRFTGGGHQIRVDNVRVTRGLTIHCDLLLSNNLEINWNGNQFHMTEHMLTTECSDDPNIIQFPPDAPLDTLIGVGTGRYNGDDGFTIEFTLVDYGEPGSSDQMAMRVFETANPGNVVLNVPLQVLTGGNLQAHYDQPHK